MISGLSPHISEVTGAVNAEGYSVCQSHLHPHRLVRQRRRALPDVVLPVRKEGKRLF